MIFKKFVLLFAQSGKRKPEGFSGIVAAFNARQTVFQTRFKFDVVGKRHGSPALTAFGIIEGFVIFDASAQNLRREL